ncbi:hypothetical protein ACF0H5_004538 [Mactra antiquata]
MVVRDDDAHLNSNECPAPSTSNSNMHVEKTTAPNDSTQSMTNTSRQTESTSDTNNDTLIPSNQFTQPSNCNQSDDTGSHPSQSPKSTSIQLKGRAGSTNSFDSSQIKAVISTKRTNKKWVHVRLKNNKTLWVKKELVPEKLINENLEKHTEQENDLVNQSISQVKVFKTVIMISMEPMY